MVLIFILNSSFGLSQREVSRLLGIKLYTVNRYIKGTRKETLEHLVDSQRIFDQLSLNLTEEDYADDDLFRISKSSIIAALPKPQLPHYLYLQEKETEKVQKLYKEYLLMKKNASALEQHSISSKAQTPILLERKRILIRECLYKLQNLHLKIEAIKLQEQYINNFEAHFSSLLRSSED